MANITIIGLGSLGSNFANILARTGQNIVNLVDNDVIEKKNISKSTFMIQDIGKYKVEVVQENILNINPEIKMTTFKNFVDELSQDEMDNILNTSDIILNCADSKQALKTSITQIKQYFNKTNRSIYLITMLCLDSASAGVTCLWSPTMEKPCPYCLLDSVPYLTSSEERVSLNKDNNVAATDYSMDSLAGTNSKGLLPDIFFGISFTSSLLLALSSYIDNNEEATGRNQILNNFLNNNFYIWSSFRDPALDWQNQNTIGKFQSLKIEKNTCFVCKPSSQSSIFDLTYTNGFNEDKNE